MVDVANAMDTEKEMVVKRLSVPLGLEELMESLTKEVLRKKPNDIYNFASEHFAQLLAFRDGCNKNPRNKTSQTSKQNMEDNYVRRRPPIKIKSATMGMRISKPPTSTSSINNNTKSQNERSDKTKSILNKRKVQNLTGNQLETIQGKTIKIKNIRRNGTNVQSNTGSFLKDEGKKLDQNRNGLKKMLNMKRAENFPIGKALTIGKKTDVKANKKSKDKSLPGIKDDNPPITKEEYKKIDEEVKDSISENENKISMKTILGNNEKLSDETEYKQNIDKRREEINQTDTKKDENIEKHNKKEEYKVEEEVLQTNINKDENIENHNKKEEFKIEKDVNKIDINRDENIENHNKKEEFKIEENDNQSNINKDENIENDNKKEEFKVEQEVTQTNINKDENIENHNKKDEFKVEEERNQTDINKDENIENPNKKLDFKVEDDNISIVTDANEMNKSQNIKEEISQNKTTITDSSDSTTSLTLNDLSDNQINDNKKAIDVDHPEKKEKFENVDYESPDHIRSENHAIPGKPTLVEKKKNDLQTNLKDDKDHSLDNQDVIDGNKSDKEMTNDKTNSNNIENSIKIEKPKENIQIEQNVPPIIQSVVVNNESENKMPLSEVEEQTPTEDRGERNSQINLKTEDLRIKETNIKTKIDHADEENYTKNKKQKDVEENDGHEIFLRAVEDSDKTAMEKEKYVTDDKINLKTESFDDLNINKEDQNLKDTTTEHGNINEALNEANIKNEDGAFSNEAEQREVENTDKTKEENYKIDNNDHNSNLKIEERNDFSTKEDAHELKEFDNKTIITKNENINEQSMETDMKNEEQNGKLTKKHEIKLEGNEILKTIDEKIVAVNELIDRKEQIGDKNVENIPDLKVNDKNITKILKEINLAAEKGLKDQINTNVEQIDENQRNANRQKEILEDEEKHSVKGNMVTEKIPEAKAPTSDKNNQDCKSNTPSTSSIVEDDLNIDAEKMKLVVNSNEKSTTDKIYKEELKNINAGKLKTESSNLELDRQNQETIELLSQESLNNEKANTNLSQMIENTKKENEVSTPRKMLEENADTEKTKEVENKNNVTEEEMRCKNKTKESIDNDSKMNNDGTGNEPTKQNQETVELLSEESLNNEKSNTNLSQMTENMKKENEIPTPRKMLEESADTEKTKEVTNKNNYVTEKEIRCKNETKETIDNDSKTNNDGTGNEPTKQNQETVELLSEECLNNENVNTNVSQMTENTKKDNEIPTPRKMLEESADTEKTKEVENKNNVTEEEMRCKNETKETIDNDSKMNNNETGSESTGNKIKAAVKIQSVIRGYFARNIFKKLLKKNGSKIDQQFETQVGSDQRIKAFKREISKYNNLTKMFVINEQNSYQSERNDKLGNTIHTTENNLKGVAPTAEKLILTSNVNDAALKIQSVWRGHKTRKSLGRPMSDLFNCLVELI